jgi:hypothetical protein
VDSLTPDAAAGAPHLTVTLLNPAGEVAAQRILLWPAK